MRKPLFFFFICLCVLSFVAGDALAKSPKVIIVKFHADDCADCEILEPAYESVIFTFSIDEILFVKFDRTDDISSHQSMMLADQLGLTDIYEQYPETGFALLIDPQTHEVIGKLTKTQNFTDMSDIVEEALERNENKMQTDKKDPMDVKKNDTENEMKDEQEK